MATQLRSGACDLSATDAVTFGASEGRRATDLDPLHVRGVGPLGPGLGVEADLRALGERLKAAARDARVVHEEILAAIVGRDEPEPLLVAEPLHRSSSHLSLPERLCGRNAGGAGNRLANACTALTGTLPATTYARLPGAAARLLGARHR